MLGTDRPSQALAVDVVHGLQPMLHELAVTLHAPTTVLSSADGQVRARGAEGLYHADMRVLSRAEVSVGGHAPDGVAASVQGTGRDLFVALVRQLGDPTPDPTVRLERRRTVTSGCCVETLRLISTASEPLRTTITVDLASDLAGVEEVKDGRGREPLAPELVTAGLRWVARGVEVAVRGDGAQAEAGDGAERLSWVVDLAPRGQVEVSWQVDVTDTGAIVAAAPDADTWATPRLRADDPRLEQLLRQSLEDLRGLRMVTVDRPRDVFIAAGAPWYLTLFGRDSLWTARMMLPLGTDLAAGTLATLASRQGRVVDAATQEAPGKILHELRRAAFELAGDTVSLPPQYFGTVDATALWVCLLHDAWRWGMPARQVEALLPFVAPSLTWMATHGDPDGDGFLEYVAEPGAGLSNQGWKDSGDSVRFADGAFATAPIALCEVQGYAHEAAISGAALLDAFGLPGAERWREWAASLRVEFRRRFWISDALGAYPAIALDADKRPVDAATSNMGHLLGTGLLDADETAAVAHRLAAPSMDSGYGLRTMDTGSGAYGPLTYHCGSVWPHDTAIAVAGLVREGHRDVAATLLQGLLAAADGFGWRLPELFSGDAREEYRAPVPYPASCRPQAWAAASAVTLVGAVLGLDADAPSGTVKVHPMTPSPVGAMEVSGLRVGGEDMSVGVDAAGAVVSVETPAGVTLA